MKREIHYIAWRQPACFVAGYSLQQIKLRHKKQRRQRHTANTTTAQLQTQADDETRSRHELNNAEDDINNA